MKVTLTFVNSPNKSMRQSSWELGIRRALLQRIMHQLHFKPYRSRLLHDLLEEDLDRRPQFCEITCNQLTEQPNLRSKIIWTDGTCFKLSSLVSRHNSV
ncbi:hypothetical protein TNCT_398421 [Trichonephila clavata]|uniref:Uncharacterized protein n=1 Tax=Trichonephila clavata TaxID=2740835 RepID=A0A8X6L4G3_TRICU|nr:hypothetical protein TNCT_398421 [Trichonephila clavata]